MSRFLFVVLSEKGHVHPFIGPAQELLLGGHEVAFYAPCDIRASLARAGLTQVFAGPHPGPLPAENRGSAFAALVADRARLRAWIHAMLIESVPGEVERLSEVASVFHPDVIVADPMAYAAPIVAARSKIPWAGLSTSLNPVVPDDWTSELIETTRSLPREALFARYGVTARFRVSDCSSPYLDVAFTTEELVGAPPSPVLLAGASLPRAARGDEADHVALRGDRPLVFMSLGSQIHHQPRMFEVVMEALRGAPFEVVLAMGELASTSDVPPHIHAVRYAPQLDLLARASVMISHGGANSIMEALAHGVPLLVSPICNDQPHNARFVEQAGAGVTCELATSTPAEVRAALMAVASDGPHRAAARRIGASYRARDGAAVVTDALLRLAR